jgi:HNH endonuclease
MTELRGNGSTHRWRLIRARILMRDTHRCHWCGGYANTVDHVVPRIEGGTDDAANLVAACMRCNSARSMAWVLEHRGAPRQRRQSRRAVFWAHPPQATSNTSSGRISPETAKLRGVRRRSLRTGALAPDVPA